MMGEAFAGFGMNFCSRRYGPFRPVVNALVALLLFSGTAAAKDRLRIVALGDSLTAGYGLAAEEAFPARLEARLAALGIEAEVVNAGVSGDTTAGGLARLDWALAEKPDFVLVELGANDALRGLDPAAAKANLDKILAGILARGAKPILLGMLALGNWGREYGTAFNAIYPELAQKYAIPLYPFFLDGVAQDPGLNLPDGLHPNAQGVERIVERLAPFLRETLKEGA
jgi:acyl-CoA thioesterase-1